MGAPESYIRWVNDHLGFNPRAQQNSNALADFFVADLRLACPSVDKALVSGTLKATKNADVFTKVSERNVDLVLHSGRTGPDLLALAAVENKTIMAAHGKARKNRYGDHIAYCNHMHNHRKECIAAALVVINISATYENPDSFAKGLLRAKFDMLKVVTDTIRIFTRIPLRNDPEEPNDQPEALGIILVDYDGVRPAKLVDSAPAPSASDACHYEKFLRRVVDLYERRFA